MKTLKVVGILIIIIGIAPKIANSQPPVRGTYPTINFVYTSGCIDEDLIGNLNSETLIGNHYSEKTTGTLYGAISGDAYSFENNWQGHWYTLDNGLTNWTAEYNVTLRKDGKLVSIAHWVMTLKMTPSGQEVTSERLFENCKKF